jgi:hypothetical protein
MMTILTDLHSHSKTWISCYDQERGHTIVLERSSLSLDKLITSQYSRGERLCVQGSPSQQAKDAQRRLDMKQKFADGSISDACAQFIDLADGTADWFNGPKIELRPLGTY